MQELIELEKRYWRAIQDGDVETALSMTEDPCLIAGERGVTAVGAAQFRQIMQARTNKIDDVELSDVQVRMLTNDVAIVVYKVHERLTADGKATELDAADASTWVRRSGRWVCALHTEAKLKQS
jgi:uncharacterized protein (TIGR02246 family)